MDPADADWVAARLRPLAGLEDQSELGGGRGTEAFAAWRRFFEGLAASRPLDPRLRGSSMGRRGPARLRRSARRLGDGRAAARRLHGPSRAARAPTELGRRKAQRHDDRARASDGRRDNTADERGARPLRAPRGRSAGLARACGRKSSLRRAVRAAVSRTRLRGRAAAPRDAAGHHQRASRRAARRREGIPPLGSRRREGLLDRRARERRRSTPSPSSTPSIRKGFLRRQRRSSVAGEIELAFAHALVRDVAYGQLPRADRAEKHRDRRRMARLPRPKR